MDSPDCRIKYTKVRDVQNLLLISLPISCVQVVDFIYFTDSSCIQWLTLASLFLLNYPAIVIIDSKQIRRRLCGATEVQWTLYEANCCTFTIRKNGIRIDQKQCSMDATGFKTNGCISIFS
jgi:hypothetical protein